ncbi:hypothetical protein ABZ733_15025 [Streptomyces longwoodensis]|uniref:hypothetical protein n=1 Tax=Streptomyces longwoodensis TaxID=68231 RepID=UPI0033FE811E
MLSTDIDPVHPDRARYRRGDLLLTPVRDVFDGTEQAAAGHRSRGVLEAHVG